MSIAPLIFSDWWDHLERPHSLLDQDFGLGFNPQELMVPAMVGNRWGYDRRPMVNYHQRPWARNQGTSVVKADKDQFHVNLDVQQFKPDEISVKVVDKFIVVEGRHEEKQDEHGFIERHFTRKYLIPEQCNIDQVKSSLSSDGVLSVTVPRKNTETDSNEKVIQIEHTGKPAIAAKEHAKPKEAEASKTEKKVSK